MKREFFFFIKRDDNGKLITVRIYELTFSANDGLTLACVARVCGVSHKTEKDREAGFSLF